MGKASRRMFKVSIFQISSKITKHFFSHRTSRSFSTISASFNFWIPSLSFSLTFCYLMFFSRIDVIKIHKEAIWVALPSKTDPFKTLSTIPETSTLLTSTKPSSQPLSLLSREREREREKERIIDQKRRKETDTHTHTPRERYEIFFSVSFFGFWVWKRRILGGWFEGSSWWNQWVQRRTTPNHAQSKPFFWNC